MTQEKALEILKTGANCFLTGEPGAGKTHTINQFRDWAKQNGKVVAMTASTGIAATHINGVTIHSWIGAGLKKNLTDKQIDAILANDWTARRIEGADILIIDEISMLDADRLNDIDKIMRKQRNFMDDRPFGGAQVVFVGDFFQLPPVPDWDSKNKPQFAFQSAAWKAARLHVLYLTEQHRQEDPVFLRILSRMRSGTLEQEDIDVLTQRSIDGPPDITRLFTHNKDVEHLNTIELEKLPGDAQRYDMYCQGIPFMVERLQKSCLSPQTLILKKGAIVMFTRNLFDRDTGKPTYVNGTIGRVERFTKNGIPVVWTKDGKEIVVERAIWEYEENGVSKASIEQYPLRLAWALTVHKSQGVSLDAAFIDLSAAFEYGQGYVALSRVRSLEGLFLKAFNPKALRMHPYVVTQDALFRNISES